MTRGTNNWYGSGAVCGDPVYGRTKSGESACSFMISVQKFGRGVTRVRVNVFGGLVHVCEQKLQKGIYVVVTGELMNRERRSISHGEELVQLLTEVRAEDLVFCQGTVPTKEDDYESEEQGDESDCED